MKLFTKLSVVTLILLTQACTSLSGKNGGNSMNNLVIAEPLAVSYKSEIALARLTEVISRADVSDAQRAQLLYDRGVIFDSVGLRSLARLDFNRALRLKTDLVDAYNFIGIHLTQEQEFNQAYEAFDSAIELQPQHDFAYLNRGIALYYGGRSQLAVDDFKTFYQYQTNDPYRMIWLFLAQYQVEKTQALQELKSQSLELDNVWAKQVIRLYLGELSSSEFIARLTENVADQKALTERLCEAYFYLGKFSQMQGADNVAANYFKLALSTNVYEFVEHRYAKLELDLMRQEIRQPAEH